MAPGGGERWGRGQEVEGAEWVTVGQLSPSSAQTLSEANLCLLNHPEPGSCHSRHRV